MGVAQVSRSQAAQALLSAMADVNEQHERQVAIGKGLLGAVLNALSKGFSEEEISFIFREQKRIGTLREALAISPDAVAPQHAATLREILAMALEFEADEHMPATSG